MAKPEVEVRLERRPGRYTAADLESRVSYRLVLPPRVDCVLRLERPWDTREIADDRVTLRSDEEGYSQTVAVKDAEPDEKNARFVVVRFRGIPAGRYRCIYAPGREGKPFEVFRGEVTAEGKAIAEV